MEFLWYDYETSGDRPRRHRPVQFAGVRTDGDLQVIDDPVMCYCRPAPDQLPQPEASLVHGLAPSYLEEHGLSEADFAHRIHRELARPGTCSVGYNAIRFDHEHTRFLFYRNLLDPYAWHWRDGNTRWDLIDLFRAAYALRPEGIAWPMREDGKPSFRLQHLAAENGVGGHGAAHEALADVMTTIDMARLVRARQPKLFEWSLRMRYKKEAAAVMQDRFVWVASLFQGRGCAAPVFRLANQSGNPNAAIVFDMSHDPSEFIGLSVDALHERIFSPGSRSPIFVVKTNRCPFVAPFSVLTDEVMDRLGLDADTLKKHERLLRDDALLGQRVRAAYVRPPEEVSERAQEEPDVDEALYTGFIPDQDRRTLARLLEQDRTLAAAGEVQFVDRKRLEKLIFRYRARNFFDDLGAEEQELWRTHCKARHLTPDPDAGGRTALDTYYACIDELRGEHADAPEKVALLDDLKEHGRRLAAWLG